MNQITAACGPMPAPPQNLTGMDVLDIGIVDNMPGHAGQAYEPHFARIIKSAAHAHAARIHLFCLPELLGGLETGPKKYLSTARLPHCRLDALVVTGAEPRERDLTREAYWSSLVDVFDWAEENTISVVASCLAAHAAVLHRSGIRAQRLPSKRCGVFDHRVAGSHALFAATRGPVRVAHSRWNDLPADDLLTYGYDVLTRSDEAGVDVFVRQGRSLLVCCQGHPEYGPGILGREYRRDVGRFLCGETEAYPALPQNYFDDFTRRRLSAFADAAVERRQAALFAKFPVAPAPAGAGTAGLFGRWLQIVAAAKRRNETNPLGELALAC